MVSLALVCLLRSVMFTGFGGVTDILTRNYDELIYIFIHNGHRGSHDTSDIKSVGLQLVRYSYLVSDATLASGDETAPVQTLRVLVPDPLL